MNLLEVPKAFKMTKDFNCTGASSMSATMTKMVSKRYLMGAAAVVAALPLSVSTLVLTLRVKEMLN